MTQLVILVLFLGAFVAACLFLNWSQESAATVSEAVLQESAMREFS